MEGSDVLCCFYLIQTISIYNIFFLLIIHLIFNHKDVLNRKLIRNFLREDGARRPPSYYKPHPRPLPVGEGSEYLYFLLEDGARRPSSYYGLQG